MFALEINPQKDGADGERENPGRSRRKTIKRRGLFLFFYLVIMGFGNIWTPRERCVSPAQRLLSFGSIQRDTGDWFSPLFFFFFLSCLPSPPDAVVSLPCVVCHLLLFCFILSLVLSLYLCERSLVSIVRVCVCVCMERRLSCVNLPTCSLSLVFLVVQRRFDLVVVSCVTRYASDVGILPTYNEANLNFVLLCL